MTNPIPTVALYGAVSVLINVALAINVSRMRNKEKVSLGNGDSPEMINAVRAHGNNAEYVPLALLMLLIAEISGGASVVLHVFGGTLIVARLAHARGLIGKLLPARILGTVLTWLILTGLAVYILMLRYGA